MAETHSTSFKQFCSRWKFSMLLGLLLLLNAGRVATLTLAHDRVLMDLLGATFLVFATLSLCVERRSRIAALVLGLPAITLTVLGIMLSKQTESDVLLWGRGASMVFLGFTIAVILGSLLSGNAPTRDSISGAFCGYILIAALFAEGYSLIEAISPHSFRVDNADPEWSADPVYRWFTLQYFSFTTLTTLGFGDIVPISSAARGLVIWEAVCGQFYLAVLVAGLVNLRGSRTNESGNTAHRES